MAGCTANKHEVYLTNLMWMKPDIYNHCIKRLIFSDYVKSFMITKLFLLTKYQNDNKDNFQKIFDNIH